MHFAYFVPRHLFPLWDGGRKMAPAHHISSSVWVLRWSHFALPSSSWSPVPLLMAWNVSGGCSFRAPSLQSMLVKDVGRLLSVRVGLVCFRGGKQRGKLLSCLGKLCWKENMPYTGVLLLSEGNLEQKGIFLFLLFLFLCRH